MATRPTRRSGSSRIMLAPDDSGPVGFRFRVYLYGFSPGNQVQVRWYDANGTTYHTLGTLTIAANGRAIEDPLRSQLRNDRHAVPDSRQRRRNQPQRHDDLHRDRPGGIGRGHSYADRDAAGGGWITGARHLAHRDDDIGGDRPRATGCAVAGRLHRGL